MMAGHDDTEYTVVFQDEDDDQELSHPGETIKTVVAQGDPKRYLIQKQSHDDQTVKFSSESSSPASGDDETVVGKPSRIGISVSEFREDPAKPVTIEGKEQIVLRTCNEEYIILELIGEGGQGQVFEAIQKGLGRKVALKRATRKKTANHEDFVKEAFISAQLDHPNMVPVYDLGFQTDEGEEVPVLSMKRVVGIPWKDLLYEDRQDRKMPLEDFLAKHLPIYKQVLNAMAFAHSKRVIHRDLKPSQIMVGDFGEVYLLDWGLSIYLDDKRKSLSPIDSQRAFTLVTASNPAGTPAYMAPEQAQFHTDQLGIHTDIYLLGAMLYELLAGNPPHEAVNGKIKLSTVRNNLIRPLEENTPKDLREIVMKCLSMNHEDRPDSVWIIKKAIDGYLSGSNRKSESKEITDHLVSCDPQSLDNYEELSRQSQMLSQALSLWPNNPDIEFCRNMILAAYVSVAIRHGDFLLATVQADRVEDDEWSDLLRDQVDEAKKEAARRFPEPSLFTTSRFFTLLTAYILIIAVVAGFVMTAKNTMINETLGRVESLASLASDEISALDLAEVADKQEIYSPEFQRIFSELLLYKRSNADITEIYTFLPDFGISPDTWRFLVTTDPLDWDVNSDGLVDSEEVGNPPGTIYETNNRAMKRAFKESRVTSSLQATEQGLFVAGFAPIIDEETGGAAAITAVYIDSRSVQARLQTVYIVATLGGLFLFAIVTATFLAFFQSRRALEKLALVEEEIKKQNSALRGKKIHL